jgi:hypothetical protein
MAGKDVSAMAVELRSGKKKGAGVGADAYSFGRGISDNGALVGNEGLSISIAGADAYSFDQGHFGHWSTCWMASSVTPRIVKVLHTSRMC